jgi:uncharacterized protein
MLGRRVLPARRLARLGATLVFHHGLLGSRREVQALACALAVACSIVACGGGPPDTPENYTARVAAAREAKDAQFLREDEPIPKSSKSDLLPLAYFPIDPDYNVVAALTPATERIVQSMPTSTGQRRQMLQVGRLDFTLKGQQMSLLAYNEGDMSRLSVMFSDMTSGTETYPAGRYIDLDRTGTNIYELDFNKAYNPYCYYNVSYECPFPPPENRLKIPVHAGERMKKSHGAGN